MVVHCLGQARPPHRGGQFLRVLRSITVAASAVLLITGCKTSAPFVAAAADPADPNAPVAATAHRSTIGTYVRQRPVEPRPWAEQNQGVAPRQRE